MKLISIVVILSTVLVGCDASDDPDIPALIQKSKLSVVRVVVLKIGPDKKPTPLIVGTGFVVDTGLVATAAHVVKDLPEGTIFFLVPANQEQFDIKQNSAKVLACEPKHDIAIIECPTLKSLPSLMLYPKSEVKIGEDALILGFPLSDSTLTATRAMVAAKSKRQILDDDPNLTDMFKLDTSINMGNSGGPVIHVRSGKVIGIVSSKIGSISKNLQIFREKKPKGRITIAGDDPIGLIKNTLTDMERNLQLGLGYGVSVDYLKTLLKQLEQKEKKKQ